MLIFCPIDRLRLSKSDDAYGGVSHTTIVSEEKIILIPATRLLKRINLI
jgi:hypothetical protein